MSFTIRTPKVPSYARSSVGVLAILVVPLGLLLATTISASLRSVDLAAAAADAEDELARLDRLAMLEVSLTVERLAVQLERTHDDLEIGSADLRLLLRKTRESMGDVTTTTDQALAGLPVLMDQIERDLASARAASLDPLGDRAVATRYDSLLRAVHLELLGQDGVATRAVVALRDDETAITLQRAVASRNAVLSHLELVDRLFATWTVEPVGLQLAKTELTELRARWLADEEQLAGTQQTMPTDGGRFDRMIESTLLLETPVLDTDSIAVAELLRATDDGLRRQQTLVDARTEAAAAVQDAAATRHSDEQGDARRGAALAAVAVLVSLTAAGIYIATNVRKNRENHGLTRELAIQAHRDHLTGEGNRAAAMRGLQEHLDELRRPLAVAFFDLDRFKNVNDTYGHTIGDELLRAAARRTRKTVDSAAIVARFGGDEFVVVLPDLPGGEDPVDVIRPLHAALQEPYVLEGNKVHTTASLGLAVVRPGDGTEDADDALRRAALAVAAAKEVRGAMIEFTPEFGAELEDESRLQRELMEALGAEGQLWLAFQPIVDVDTGQVREVEALVRWDHPVRGQISPDSFIPIAEKSILIHDLGLCVLAQVCNDLPSLPDVPVNVNVSARQFRLGDFTRDYLGVLDKYSVNASRIVLEITESFSLETSKRFIGQITDLREAGFRIALDDFGLGYSEFNQLRQLPFDIIKIDKSYIQNIGLDRVTDVFVSAVVQVAVHLDCSVVAEGIEGPDDRIRAAAAGCPLFQGYHFLAPSPAAEIARIYCSADQGQHGCCAPGYAEVA